MFIYPNNLKEKKLFMKLTVVDLVIEGLLVIIFVIYASKTFSIVPLLFPGIYALLKVRFLEDSSNLWELFAKVCDYLLNSQQVYFWGSNEGED